MHMHTITHTDTGPLDRFAERWSKHATHCEANEKDARKLRSMQTGYSLRCGQLYRYSFETFTEERANDDACKRLARLHVLGLLAIENGQVHASEAGLELLAKYPLRR